jgi:hypothetical protein
VTQNIVEELAPYPKREEDVTAEGLARYYAVLAELRLGRIGLPGNSVEAETIEVLGYVHEYAADRAARAVWRALDAGEMTGEQLWEWLTEWGIDPDRLRGDDGAPVAASSETDKARQDRNDE